MSSFIPIKGKTGECDPHRPPVPEAYYTKRETDALLATKVSFDQFNNHILNTTVHITAEERAAWNNKITEPAEEGSAGDVLVTDGEGGRTWSASPTHTATWGQITGTLSNQTDLHTRLTTDETNISNEVTRATSAEGLLGQRITTETTRATNAESVLTSSIAAEVTRAQGAEATLQSNLTAEATTRGTADETLQDNIDAENARAEEAELIIQQNVESEATRAQGAETTLNNLITAEVTRAGVAETQLQSNITAEATTRAAADTTLTTNLAAEVTRATGVEATKENVSNKVTEILSTSTHTEYASAKSVYDAISAIPKALVYKGTIGVGGTIQVLPEATEDRGGWTYKVITEAIYPPMTEKASIGDLIVCAWEEEPQPEGTYKWTLIPAGAEKVKDVQINRTSILSDAGVANIPYATSSSIGVVKGNTAYDVGVTSDGSICGYSRTLEQYAGRSNSAVIAKGTIENIKTDLTGRALADTAAPAYTTEQKTAAQNRLGVTEAIATETTRAEAAEAALQTAVDSKVADVKINGTTIVDENKCANIPIATGSSVGVVRPLGTDYGFRLYEDGRLRLEPATVTEINERAKDYKPIVPKTIVNAVDSVLCSTSASEALTTEQKEAALTRLGAEGKKFYNCTYGTTTAEEIATALTKNLVPYVYTNDRYYFYSGSSSNYHFFNDVYSTGLSSTTSYCCFCDKSNNTWSSASRTLQQSNDRTDDILTNKTASTKYPSTKGVFDYAVGNVKVNGTALTKDENGDVNIPRASWNTLGVVKTNDQYGTCIVDQEGTLAVAGASTSAIDGRTSYPYTVYKPPIATNKLNYAVTAALTDSNKAVLTDTQKESAKNTIGVDTDINRIDNYIDGNLNGKTTNTEVANIKNLPTNVYSTTVNDIGGNSIVWNQYVDTDSCTSYTSYGVTFTVDTTNHCIKIDGTATQKAMFSLNEPQFTQKYLVAGHYYYVGGLPGTNTNVLFRIAGGYVDTSSAVVRQCTQSWLDDPSTGIYLTVESGATVSNYKVYPKVFDLTLMFGAGNEPSTVAEFEAMFPNEYYPYSVPTVTHAAVDKVIYRGDGLTTEVNVPTAVQQLEGYGWGIGNYYNEVNYSTKKYIKRVGTYTFTGNETAWQIYNPSTYIHNDGFDVAFVGLTFVTSSNEILCKSNYFVGYPAVDGIWSGEGHTWKMCCNAADQMHFNIPHSETGTSSTSTAAECIAAFKTWLQAKATAGNPLTVYYVLATATLTDITSLLTNTDIIKDTVTKNHITAQFNNTLQLPMYNSITSTSKKSVVNDVTINNTSIVTDGVANIPIASSSNLGVVKIDEYRGITINTSGKLTVNKATNTNINARTDEFRPIVSINLDYAVKAALTDGVGPAYTTTEQEAARTRIGAQKSKFFDVTYGTTTYAEITAAIEAGLTPICTYNSGVYNFFGPTTDKYTFSKCYGTLVYYVQVNTSNTWSSNAAESEGLNKYRNYFRRNSGANGLPKYMLCAEDVDGRMTPIALGDTTATTKTACTVPFRPEQLWHYNSSTTVAAGSDIGQNTLYTGIAISTCAYLFNSNVPGYSDVYLCGAYDKTTGLFTLDSTSTTSYYVFVPNNTSGLVLSNYFDTGKYYIKVGSSTSSANNMQITLTKPMYYFNGTSLVDGKEDFHVMDATTFESLPVKSGYYFVY